MKLEKLEATVKELKKQNKTLQKEVVILKDIESIKRLQRSYGYYLEHGMAKEVVDLFADGRNVSLWHAGIGTYSGKKGVWKFFERFGKGAVNPGFLHQVIQLSGIVDVHENGKTAKGRWYGLGTVAIPTDNGTNAECIFVIYECDYVKENGKWKFKIMRVYITHAYNIMGGLVKPVEFASVEPGKAIAGPQPDISDYTDAWYPSGFIVPFHFKHPITGKKTSEGARNSSLKKSKLKKKSETENSEKR